MQNKRNKVFLIFTLFYIYFTMALFESSRGNFIPFFIDEFKINNTVISLILSLYTVGCTIGSFLGGHFCEKFGHKTVYILGSLASTIAVFIAPFTANIYMIGLFFFLFGIGRSLLAIGVDSMIPILSIGFETILMNITHFMFGMGSFLGQSAYGRLLSQGMPWRTIYLYLGIFFFISVILTLLIKTPAISVKNVTVKKENLYKNKVVYMFVIAVTFGLITEAVLNTWFISYMRETYGLNPASAASYSSIYFLSFALGRLLGGFIINKIGNVKGFKLFLALAATFILVGLQLKSKGLILIAMSGFFISIIFPTIMVLINYVFKSNASFAIGLIVTISNILNVILFNVVGILNDLLGPYTAFYAAPISIICCLSALIMIFRKNTNNI